LAQVLTGVIELKELKTKGLLAKKHMRFIQSCMTILNLEDAAQLEQRFGEQQMNALFLQYASSFGKTPKNPPKNIDANLTMMIVEWLARQKGLVAARSAQEEKTMTVQIPTFTSLLTLLCILTLEASEVLMKIDLHIRKEFTDTSIFIHKEFTDSQDG
jgi:hypothetical protein